MGTSDEKPGFTVSDRRASAEPGASNATSGAGRGGEADPGTGMPPVEFATFVLSLGSSALLHLGELENPEDQEKPRVDLGLAQHTIDVLAMLQEKTRGNLTDAEATLVENLLFDLRLRFVETSQAQKQKRG